MGDDTSCISRVKYHLSRINLDRLIGLALFIAGLYAYTTTLAPTVLEGDKALFQYTPYVLGVTYPTGFPLYILLGKLWLTLFPFGEIAWRMNLLSALCAAAALPLLYTAARSWLASRWAALTAVLALATLPTFWLWATVAKTYPLNMLLLTGVLCLLAIAAPNNNPPITYHARLFPPLALSAWLLGLQISVHNTAVLLIPGLALLVWLNFKPYLLNRKSFILYVLLWAVPLLFYLYIPLRGEWLMAQYGRDQAIQRGLLADFYRSGPAGWLEYFTAAKFTGGIAAKWGLIPQRFMSVYLPLLVDNFTWPGIALAVVGGLALALRRPRLFWPLLLIYAVPIPFVLTYDQGEQSAFLLPSFLVVGIFAGNSLTLIRGQQPAAKSQAALPFSAAGSAPHHFLHMLHAALPAIVVLVLIPLFFTPQVRYNLNWLSQKWNRAIYDEWADALNHPLTPGAAMLAHWGDLTPFWYMQHAEGRRPDLLGLYPPDEANVEKWFTTGGSDLYIAGPLQGWAPGMQERYQLIPWGRLVRLAPLQTAPKSLLPALPRRLDVNLTPPNAPASLRLISADIPAQAVGGSDYPVTLTWQALSALPPETTLSLRLSQDDKIAAQLDDTLLSGWFPSRTLSTGQYGLSYAPILVPLGTLPGRYRLQLAAYTDQRRPWLTPDGLPVLDLGEIEIILPPPDDQPVLTNRTKPGYDFNGELKLAEYDYSVSRVGQGKGFALRLLWRATTQPADNYTLQVEQLNPVGQVIRASQHQPPAPTGGWLAGQYVRDPVDLVVPAGAPPGDNALRVRLSWLRPNGSKLTVRRWLISLDDGLNLDGLTVVEKEGRVFATPEFQHTIGANFENKTRLLGYNAAGSKTFDQNFECAILSETCQFQFEFYWQGLGEMEAPYVIFLHVVDKQEHIVAQHDHAPGTRGKQPTTGWLPGEIVADPIDLQLPANLAPGRYTIRLGMYLPPDGPRLLVLNEQGQATGDFVEAGHIMVTP